MTTETLTVAEVETLDEASEPRSECHHCGESVRRVDLQRATHEEGYACRVCTPCLGNSRMFDVPDYTMSFAPVHVHIAQIVCAEDTGGTASLDYAQAHWYYNGRSDSWTESWPESSDDDEDEGGALYDYSKDVIRLHGWPMLTPSDALCFGVELEMEAKRGHNWSELVQALGGKDGNGSFLLKSDGSLDNGVELVTLPFTLEDHQSYFNWKEVLEQVRPIAHSGEGTTNCGIHIHINRAALTPLVLGKMLVFVNATHNVNFIKMVAQRDAQGWAAFKDKKITDGKYSSDYKYEALNVKNATVEVRIFRGNLRPERILKNIEFCHALVSFCRVASMAQLTFQAFLQFIGEPQNRKPHARLIRFIKEKSGSSELGRGLYVLTDSPHNATTEE